MKKLLSGLTIPQQYVCISLEDLRDPLSVFLSANGTDESVDVTNNHIFVGYRPLVIAIPFPLEKESLASRERISLHFVYHDSLRDGRKVSTDQGWIARLTLKAISSKRMDERRIVFYEGIHGEHSFIRGFHQFVNNHRERWRKDIPGNVRLPGNLHDQVRIAYSLPRIISLITVSDGKTVNIFPTDLHGPWGSEFYVSSLRQGGKASAQVEGVDRLVLSSMPVHQYKEVYGFGKNHMQEMKDATLFPLSERRSRILKCVIPTAALHYRELEIIESFDVGIHRIYLYKLLGQEKVADGKTLAHVHQYYAQWRQDHGLALDTFLR